MSSYPPGCSGVPDDDCPMCGRGWCKCDEKPPLNLPEEYEIFIQLLVKYPQLLEFWGRGVPEPTEGDCTHTIGDPFCEKAGDDRRNGRKLCDSMEVGDFMEPIVIDDGVYEGTPAGYQWVPHIKAGKPYDIERLVFVELCDTCCDGDWQPYDEIPGTDEALNDAMNKLLGVPDE